MRSLRVVLAAAAIIAGVTLVAACGQSASGSSGSGLASRTINTGSVEVSIQPLRLDGSGASFRVKLDTHSGDLNLDLAQAAHLEVDGTDWGSASWVGDPAGGHHRQGELQFASAGPVRGEIRLTISGLRDPVQATWNIASG